MRLDVPRKGQSRVELTPLKPRPFHPKRDPEAQDVFKKASVI
ncbi:winged helix-turn-helix domain-containing protein [Rhodovastum atsumiense]|uniref:Winged helix-turn-helix domain-containing protein n=1 Tax=Rhodovastum atsumiense TaxID=504468 RepID=A0A5M6IK89_9PROT|nr:winged helix-turn-helix domain-containing protein [Rhodovastum atsumiense]